MNKVRWFLELAGDVLIISLGALSLHIFICLSIYGEVTLLERINWVRYMETVLAGLVILFGFYHFINDWRRKMATEVLRPSAAGDECNIDDEDGAACPNHYQNVDEVTSDEGTTTVKTDASLYLRDLYNIDNHTKGYGVINKVVVAVRALAETSIDQASLKIVVKTGGTAYEGAAKTLTTSYVDYTEEWITNPGGGAWTWAQIDALQIGVSIREGLFNGNTNTIVTQVSVRIDYKGRYKSFASV